jgi:hypothetical protein
MLRTPLEKDRYPKVHIMKIQSSIRSGHCIKASPKSKTQMSRRPGQIKISIMQMIERARKQLKGLSVRSIVEWRDDLRRRGARPFGTSRYPRRNVRADDQLALESARLTALEIELVARASGWSQKDTRHASALYALKCNLAPVIPVIAWEHA